MGAVVRVANDPLAPCNDLFKGYLICWLSKVSLVSRLPSCIEEILTRLGQHTFSNVRNHLIHGIRQVNVGREPPILLADPMSCRTGLLFIDLPLLLDVHGAWHHGHA